MHSVTFYCRRQLAIHRRGTRELILVCCRVWVRNRTLLKINERAFPCLRFWNFHRTSRLLPVILDSFLSAYELNVLSPFNTPFNATLVCQAIAINRHLCLLCFRVLAHAQTLAGRLLESMKDRCDCLPYRQSKTWNLFENDLINIWRFPISGKIIWLASSLHSWNMNQQYFSTPYWNLLGH